MNETRVSGVLVRHHHPLSDIAANNLRSTIRIIPAPHLRHIRQIDVLPPLNFGSNPNYAGGGSGVGHPRLSDQTLLTGGASPAVRAALLSGNAFSGVDLVHP